MGSYDGKELSVSVGRFGPYVKWGDEFVSIPRGTDLATVDTEKAIEFIKAKQLADAPVGEYDNKPITKGTGRFGPFIKWDGLFINVPRRYDFANLAQADMNELIEAKVSKEANRYIQRWEAEKYRWRMHVGDLSLSLAKRSFPYRKKPMAPAPRRRKLRL